MTAKAILWFRNDLRLSDNPALAKAVQIGDILPIYIYDDANPVDAEPGSASRVWLHHSLDKLNQSLDGHLALFRGDPIEIIPKIVQKYEISHVNWNRQYEPWAMQRDTTVKKYLKDSGVNVESHNG